MQILVTQVVLIENQLDDIASPLDISSNMLIKAAITKTVTNRCYVNRQINESLLSTNIKLL